MLDKIDTVIVGGGQAGLAISYYPTQADREHVALERAPAVANAWRNQRWDPFTLVTPNFQVRMPGAEYSGDDPYGLMSLAEVVEYFDNCIERIRLPVHCGIKDEPGKPGWWYQALSTQQSSRASGSEAGRAKKRTMAFCDLDLITIVWRMREAEPSD